MLFTTLKFLLFFVIVFAIYWISGKVNKKLQDCVLLLASYVFYGIAEWRMIPLLFVSTAIFYWIGIAIGKDTESKKASLLTTLGVVLGVGTLLYFKYFNFFIQSFRELFEAIGLQTNIHTFNIIMPLGVSYFTFKLISYVIEVHRTKMPACKDFISFANFIAFFPTIMSGPIDRPNKFLVQLENKREFTFDLGVNGIQQIIYGLFKKAVIADNLAIYVTNIWDNYQTASSSSIVLALFFFLFQIFADFSGYSDMAIGVSKLMGFKVTQNFDHPFFSTNIAEFWRKWHMSLTSWVTDYIFIPLNIKFRNIGQFGLFLAMLINMVVIGLWHGANWTYALFGIYQTILFIPLIITGKINKKVKVKTNRLGLPIFTDILKMIWVFVIFAFGTIFFKANDATHAFDIIQSIFTLSILAKPESIRNTILALLILIMMVEWITRKKEFPLAFQFKSRKQVAAYLLADVMILALIAVFGNTSANTFIYFQF